MMDDQKLCFLKLHYLLSEMFQAQFTKII